MSGEKDTASGAPAIVVDNCARSSLRDPEIFPGKTYQPATKLGEGGYGFSVAKLRDYATLILKCARDKLGKPHKPLPQAFPSAALMGGTLDDLVNALIKAV